MSKRELLDTDGENKAVRWFLAGYGGGMRHTVGNMKTHLKNCGYPFWPAWADGHGKDVQHLTKGGAQLWLRHLFDLEIANARAQAAPAGAVERGDLSAPCPHCHAGPHYLCGHYQNPVARQAPSVLEDAALMLEAQHTWLTNVAAANLVRAMAAKKGGE